MVIGERQPPEYADLAADELKKAVKKAGNSVKKDIQEGAPKDTGRECTTSSMELEVSFTFFTDQLFA